MSDNTDRPWEDAMTDYTTVTGDEVDAAAFELRLSATRERDRRRGDEWESAAKPRRRVVPITPNGGLAGADDGDHWSEIPTPADLDRQSEEEFAERVRQGVNLAAERIRANGKSLREGKYVSVGVSSDVTDAVAKAVRERGWVVKVWRGSWRSVAPPTRSRRRRNAGAERCQSSTTPDGITSTAGGAASG